jgi:hypothetical protein
LLLPRYQPASGSLLSVARIYCALVLLLLRARSVAASATRVAQLDVRFIENSAVANAQCLKPKLTSMGAYIIPRSTVLKIDGSAMTVIGITGPGCWAKATTLIARIDTFLRRARVHQMFMSFAAVRRTISAASGQFIADILRRARVGEQAIDIRN